MMDEIERLIDKINKFGAEPIEINKLTAHIADLTHQLRETRAVSSKAHDALVLAYGLLWHMEIDRNDSNLYLASEARKALLAVMTIDDQFRGLEAAKMTDA